MQLFHIIVAIVQMQQIFIVSSLNEKPYFPLYKRIWQIGVYYIAENTVILANAIRYRY